MKLNKTSYLRRPLVVIGMAVLSATATQGISAAPSEAMSAVTAPHTTSDITALAKGYEAISSALVSDDLGLANAAAYELSAQAKKINTPGLAGLAMAVAEAKSLTAARTAFKPLSETMIQIAGEQGQYVVMVCPMVEDGRWLQSAVKTQNPYMGQRMPNCGRPTVSIQSDGTQVATPKGCCGS